MYCNKVTSQFRFSTKCTNICEQQILGVLTSLQNVTYIAHKPHAFNEQNLCLMTKNYDTFIHSTMLTWSIPISEVHMNHKAEHKMLTLAVVSTCTTYFNIQELHFSL